MYTLPLLFFVRRRKVLIDTDITSLSRKTVTGLWKVKQELCWIAGALPLKYALVTCGFYAVEKIKGLQTALLEFTWKGICPEDITENAQELTYKYDDRKMKNCEHKYFLLLCSFSPVMAESQVRSTSDANLDFDDATLKGKYTYNNILMYNIFYEI